MAGGLSTAFANFFQPIRQLLELPTMPLTSQPSRRQALKLLASAPMLPLGGLATSSLLAACTTTGKPSGQAAYRSSSFTPMAAPSLADPAAMATTSVASGLRGQPVALEHPSPQ